MKKIFKSYKKLTFLQGAAFAVSLTSIVGIAATISGMNTFVPGTPISSSEVNTNFNILKTAIESNSSQIYIGTYNASLAVDPPGSTAGEYYVINTAGTINSTPYAVGDWIIFNGTIWEKIIKTPNVNNVFGRTGNIVAAEGDYNLTKLDDVTITSPVNNQVLKYNGTTWTNSTFTETDPSVSTFAKNALPTCSVGEVLKSNGTSLSCVVDNAGAGAFSGTPNRALVTTGSGEIAVSMVTDAELSYLSGVTSNIQTQLSSKTDLTNISQSITAATISSNSITTNVISGLAAPTSSSEAANKAYVDSTLTWLKNGINTYVMGDNIGIGTSTPSQKLHVAGNVKVDGNLSIIQGTSSSPSISSFTSPTTGLFFPMTNTFAISVGGTEKLRIDSSGKVGIGTMTPMYELQVNGVVSGTGAFNSSSDMRYKKEIKIVPNALKKILSLNGVSYKFRNSEFPDLKFSNHRELGVIAQTVEKVFPEAVSKDSNGFRSVAYTMLISPIIEAIREINSNTTKLENENKMLKSYLCDRDPNAPFCEN